VRRRPPSNQQQAEHEAEADLRNSAVLLLAVCCLL
jgi:hypothetical protein